MSATSDLATLEGRINAQRELIVTILASLLRDGKIADLDRIEQEIVPVNGEEDPGVVPSAAYAIEGAAAEEIRTILKAAKARAGALEA